MPRSLFCAVLLFGCAVDPSGIPGRNGEDDAAVSDGAVSDATTDLFVPDGPVTPDLGPDSGVDLGPDEMDLGPPDMGPPDMGPPDMGPPDMGPPDMGPPDMGPPDMGPPDMGPPDMGPPDMGSPDMGCGMAETCNAVDDDCDGAIDEDLGGPRGENICPVCTRAVSPGGVTYQVCQSSVEWTEARDLCRVSGYELASPETMAEDDYLDSILTGGDYWIGLNQRDGDGWEWEDTPTDRPLGGFDDWRSDEPNGSGDCARIDIGDSQWRDSDCGGIFQDNNFFVCEAP